MRDDEYKNLQEAILVRPDRGAVLKNSGGLRKLRWAMEGRGKSGGARIIYYWAAEYDQVYMLLAFPKNAMENLNDSQLKRLRTIVEEWSK